MPLSDLGEGVLVPVVAWLAGAVTGFVAGAWLVAAFIHG
jgi:hypothetical protein